MSEPTSPIMTVKEVSRYLKVHPSTVYKLVRRGALPAFKIGSDWRINASSIDSWANLAIEEQSKSRSRGSRTA